MEQKQFDVIGMTCASCQANVTKAVSKLDGVETVDVSLLSNSMKVTFDPEKTSPEAICQAVDSAGYEAELKGNKLNESQAYSLQAEWDQRKKRMEEDIHERKEALIWSLILLIPLVIIAMGPHMGLLTIFTDMKYAMLTSILQLILTMFILFFQRSFFLHGFKALIKKAPNMDSLVAIGSSAAFVYGVYGILKMALGYGLMDHEMIHSAMHSLYFESAAMIVTLVSLGKYLEARSKAKTSDALGKLVDLAPKTAVIEKDGVEIQVASDQITSGDTVVIRPGQRIPVDGVVSSGFGYVDQSAITGESIPVEKTEGDQVISATMNVNGTFKFTATKVGADTTLAQIIRLVDEAGNSKAPIARLADQVSGIFVPVVIVLAVLTGIVWLLAGKGAGFALSNAIAVLVISCPCALGLATPVAIMAATGKAAEFGILVKSAQALENLHNITAIVLDKTGTITSGKPGVTAIVINDPNLDTKSFLALAASLEAGSEHPLGKAIVEKAQQEGLALSPVSSFTAISGRGLKAWLDGKEYTAGNEKLMQEENVHLSDREKERIDQLANNGQTPLLFACQGRLLGMIAVADTIRPDSAAALSLLKKKGIHVVMLTGDNSRTAQAIAKDLDVDEVIADVLPAEKESVIRKLQDQGYKTAMVGDGINDAPALTRADVGIAIGAGTDIAIDSADIVLMKDSLMDVNTAIDLSRATIKNIKENLFWAFFYNVLGIPVAAGVFYPFFGWTLSPMLGSAAMSLSSVCVVTNALRLRFFKPKDETAAQIKAQEETRQEIEVFEEREALDEQILDSNTLYRQTISVSGMTCSHCKARVEKALMEIPQAVEAQADLENGTAKLVSKLPVQESELFEIVEKAGYVPSKYELKENTAMKKDIQITGMGCEHCKKTITDVLGKADGVTLVDVDLPAGVAHIESSQPIDDSELVKLVEGAGYGVKGITEL